MTFLWFYDCLLCDFHLFISVICVSCCWFGFWVAYLCCCLTVWIKSSWLCYCGKWLLVWYLGYFADLVVYWYLVVWCFDLIYFRVLNWCVLGSCSCFWVFWVGHDWLGCFQLCLLLIVLSLWELWVVSGGWFVGLFYFLMLDW